MGVKKISEYTASTTMATDDILLKENSGGNFRKITWANIKQYITGIFPSSDSTTAFTVKNAAATTNILVVDSTNTRVGIDTTPEYGLHCFSSQGFAAERVATHASIRGIRCNGTKTSKTQVLTDEVMCRIGGSGLMSNGQYTSASTAYIDFEASENQTSTNNGTRIRMYTTPTGSTTAAECLTLGATGAVSFPAIGTTASAANAYLSGSTNNILKSTSSIRYKKDIKPISVNKILELDPIEFKSTSSHDDPNRIFIGLAAEDVYSKIPELVNLDDNGNPDGVQYATIAVYLIDILKKMQIEMDEIKAEISKLKKA